jgi:hypothetical protein
MATPPDEHFGTRFLSEKYLPYLSLLGGAIALTFDVGCFYAIGISFFTMFSLSEHILFSVQALPIVIVLLVIFVMAVALIGSSH